MVIGGDAAGMSAASQARKRRGVDDLAIVAFERGRATSYSACGIPYWIAGTVKSEAELITRSLGSLKSAGVEIAIDDYGTGATSLPSLKRLPIDSLKIHESFVTGIGSNTDETSIVGAVVELGHALGLRVTAEGVETDAQLAHLRSLGCDAAQGYLLGRPMPEYEIEALLG